MSMNNYHIRYLPISCYLDTFLYSDKFELGPHLMRHVAASSEHEYIIASPKAVINLEDFIATLSDVSYDGILSVAQSIMIGLDTLHQARRVHGRLHPRNVLFYSDGTIKLSDFGQVEANESNFVKLMQKDISDAKELTLSLMCGWILLHKIRNQMTSDESFDVVTKPDWPLWLWATGHRDSIDGEQATVPPRFKSIRNMNYILKGTAIAAKVVEHIEKKQAEERFKEERASVIQEQVMNTPRTDNSPALYGSSLHDSPMGSTTPDTSRHTDEGVSQYKGSVDEPSSDLQGDSRKIYNTGGTCDVYACDSPQESPQDISCLYRTSSNDKLNTDTFSDEAERESSLSYNNRNIRLLYIPNNNDPGDSSSVYSETE